MIWLRKWSVSNHLHILRTLTFVRAIDGVGLEFFSTFVSLLIIFILERVCLILLFLWSFCLLHSCFLIDQLFKWSILWNTAWLKWFILTNLFLQALFRSLLLKVCIEVSLHIWAKNMLCWIASFKSFLRTWLNSFCSFLRRTLNILELFVLLIDYFALRANKHIWRLSFNFSILISIIFLILAGVSRTDVGIRWVHTVLKLKYSVLFTLTGLNISFPSSWRLC